MTALLISCDPHKHHCDMFVKLGDKCLVFECKTQDIFDCLNGIRLKITNQIKNGFDKKILIIESAWVGKNPDQSIKHATLIGRIQQAFYFGGFEIVEVPAWGPKCWQRQVLSVGGKIPDRNQTAKNAVIRAKADYPKLKWNEHTASAYCMMAYYLDNKRFKR